MVTAPEKIKIVEPNSSELKSLLNSNSPSVYIVRCENYYKIGYSYRVASRVESMRTSNPFPIKVVYVIHTEKYKELEKALHLEFSNRKHYREWFELKIDDEQKIDSFITEFLYGKSTD